MTNKSLVSIASMAMFFAIICFAGFALAADKREYDESAGNQYDSRQNRNCQDILDSNLYQCVAVSSKSHKPFDILFKFEGNKWKVKSEHFDLYYRAGRNPWRQTACECKAEVRKLPGGKYKVDFNATNDFHCVTNDSNGRNKRELSLEGLAKKGKWISSIENGQAVDYRGVSYYFECEQVGRRQFADEDRKMKYEDMKEEQEAKKKKDKKEKEQDEEARKDKW